MEARIIWAALVALLIGNCYSQAPACSGYADVTFLVDSSDAVGNQNFQKELNLVKRTVSKLNVSPSGVHVGMATYGSQSQAVFNLKDHQSSSDLINAIGQAKYVGGSEKMLDGLRLTTDQMFTPTAGVRDKTSRIVVVITAGKSSDPRLTKLQADKARDNDIDVYAVGIGGAVDKGELSGIASDPDSRYVYTADNFDSAQGLADVLGPKICNQVPEDPQFLPPPKSCLQKADLMFLVDSSSSIGQTNFQKLDDFLKNAVKSLDVGPNKVHVGLMQYSSYPSLEFPLNMHSSRYDTLKAIDQVSYMGGGANTADALKEMRQLAFSQNSGARPDVPRVAIVITDGSSANSAAVATEANNARRDNIGLIAVGVGPNVNTGELQAIADDPDSSHLFNPQSYDALNNLTSKILDAACQVQSTSPPMTTLAPGATIQPDLCKDKSQSCNRYQIDLCTGSYKAWAEVNCARFCGVCQPLYTAPPPTCNDVRTDCTTFDIASCSGQYRGYMQKNCARYCGYCGPDTQSIGYYGHCAYKGMTYTTGQKWTDGCDYECVCEDEKTGKYRCYNRCPVYHNLPADCTLVKDPDACCLQPQCNFGQKVTTSQGVSHGNVNGIDTCEYNGKQYYQDQQWQDGCSSQCLCADAKTGRHECHDLCPSYASLPSYCHLEKKPGQCCDKLVCEFQNQQGTFTGDGSTSSNGMATTPGTLPPCVDQINNCALYGQQGCTGQYKSWAMVNCKKFCNLCGAALDPGPNDKCLHNGRAYSQDEHWFIGQDKQCICENAVAGYYRCTSLCPTYTNLPTTCTVSQTPGQTCAVINCPSGTFVSSSNNLANIGNGGNINNGAPGTPYVSPTLPSGANVPPGTGGASGKAPTLKGCLYKGQIYVKGQRWNDGCTYSCECLDADTGRTQCRQRCADYALVPKGCTATTDPNDACCIKPVCADPNVVPVPHFKPYTTNSKPVAPPSEKDRFTGTGGLFGPNSGQATVLQTGGTIPPPTTGKYATGGVGHCEYKGKTYYQGDNWEDGCDYNCVCDDISYGHYTCVQKCVIYNNIPRPYCHLIQDPANPCCKIPMCMWTAPFEQVTGLQEVHPTTPAMRSTMVPMTPGLAYCEYKGKSYDKDQVWFDGCDFKCTCEEPGSNKYRCESRCADFPNVPANCQFVPDADDPSCCKVPQCPTAAPNPTPTQVPGVITGGEDPPGTATGTVKGFCEYEGKRYYQGETWDNGCEYSCVCEDQVTGKYKCTEKCVRYTDLAPNCKLVDDFTNPCCKVPRCDANPDPQATIAPNPNGGTTLRPGDKSFCVYKGVQYTWGQQWVDGCDKKCQCDNADTGVYSCTERCITYDNLPSECKLVTDPSDPCCQAPECSTPSPKNTLAPPPMFGTTKVPGQTGPDPNPNPNPKPTQSPTMVPVPIAVTGKVTGRPVRPTPTPGPNGQTVTPKPLTYCEYKGARYSQGDKWQDGCQFDCECANALEGLYECNERCPRYINLSPLCRLVKDPTNPCCEVPDCSPNPAGPSTTKAPGQLPNAPPTASPGPTPKPRDVCVYKGNQYTQGQKWYDGCDYNCECENAAQGLYRCDNRCPSFSTVPKGCHFEDDPSDPFCCKVIKCDIPTSVNGQTGTGLIPTPPPGTKTGGYATPAPNPNSPPPLPGQTTAIPLPKGYCVYKGRQYSPGSRWQDGCDYNCECLDTTGKYKCTEICPSIGAIPAACTLVPDINKPCCKTTYCDFTKVTVPPPKQTTTVGPNPFYSPTPAPVKDVCVYNGVAFKQGQTWDDGCDLKCVCENSTIGFYRCNQRCSKYNPDPNCQMVTDPRDSCCKVPSCSPPVNPTPTGAPDPQNPGKTLAPPTNGPNGPNPTPFVIPTPKPGKFDGVGIVPTPSVKPNPNGPGLTVKPPTNPGCTYGGVMYKGGQTWQDGCKYSCVCVDEMAGKYTCTEKCSVFPSLPPQCRLINDPQNPCCKIPDCVPDSGPTPNPNPNNPNTVVPPSPGAGTTPTPAPQPKSGCVYKNKMYSQGQQWNDGCDKVCVCDDGKTGFYRCSDRCPTFDNLPKECSLIPDPSDPVCCEIPRCIPAPGPQAPVTPGPTQVFTDLPTGKVTGQAPVPSPTTSKPGQSTPTPRQGCVYQNQIYAQGQRWQDGCQYNCVCDDGITGKYTCTQRCPVTGALPKQCKLVQDPKDFCCQTPVCDFSQTPTPFVPPAVTLTPTPPGQTPGPSANPTPPAFCLYNGVPYTQGQTWKDGCSTTCRCEKADQNYYSCFDRCPTYKLAPGCTLVTDPKDPCCQVPDCRPTPGPNVPTSAPSPNPDGSIPKPGPTPVPMPVPGPTGTIVGTPPPGQRTGFCEFKGQQYKTGDKWLDGCDYNCECVDQMTGIYQCAQRCSPYPNIPATCYLVQDPQDQCCKVPSCPGQPLVTPRPNPPSGPTNNPPTGPTLNPPTVTPPINVPATSPPYPTILSPLPPTQAPPTGPIPVPKDVCIYMGKSYSAGQKWDVGCDKVCICENGMSGVATCSDRCPIYTSAKALSPSCILVPDPTDPVCCKVPQCSTGPNPNPTGLIGVITGGVPIPTTNVPGAPTPAMPKGCLYKGSMYSKGQRWQDGCDYDCVCLDDMSGNYKCTDKCPRYPNLPITCKMVYDPTNPCCKKPECPPPTTVGPNGQTPSAGPSPVPDVCVYNGVPYRQGQSWQDGCSKKCVCEDAPSRRINCNDRCPTFQAIPASCQLVTDPQDSCCQILSCPPPPLGQSVTPMPQKYITGQSVPPQNPTPFTGGQADVCAYQGKAYKQGEVWQDGCTYTCVCTESSLGKYMCTDKCPTYPSLPASCTLVQDQKDPCCKVPVCRSTPTSKPPVTPPVGITPSPGSNPSITPPVGVSPVPVPPGVCVYNGQNYRKGQLWYDGCSKICRCEDSSRNFYRCEDRCTVYPQVPQGCTMVPDPKDPTCCEKPECPIQVPPNPTSGFVSTPSYPTPGSITGKGLIPTVGPTPKPDPNSPTQSTLPPLPKTGCYYDQKAYAQGQKWQVGCKYTCVCEDGTTGKYSCDELCPPVPSNLPAECKAIQDPQKPCCARVYCDTVNPVPSFPTPSVNPSQNPQVYTPPPTSSFTGAPGYCVYNGVYYKQGQTWKDGCKKLCKCEDVSTGYYTCRERCPSFNQLPPGCQLVIDQNDPCCVVPDCSPSLPTPLPNGQTPTPGTGPTPPLVFKPTPAPPGSFTGSGNGPPGVCVYNGQSYTKGQKWEDGCNFICECIDAQRGQFNCVDRCNQYYGNLPAACHYEQKPSDKCCKEVVCDFRSTLTPRPNSNPTTAKVYTVTPDMCVYNSQKYSQGSAWNDGCSSNCKCIDAVSNNYVCTQRCAVYTSLPKECSLTTDPSDPCCKTPTCTGTFQPIIGGGGPTSSPTQPPSVTNVFPLGTHTTITGAQLPNQGSTGTAFGSRVGCVYKSKLHRQGDAWDDGCDYVCQCMDESVGSYNCTSKCPQLPPLPSYCTLMPIPGQCCPTVTCRLPGKGVYSPVPELTPDLIPTIGTHGGNSGGNSPYPGQGTPVPPGVSIGSLKDKCVSKDNKMYNQGESWLQGCDYNCTCLDARSGYFNCLPLCPIYENLPSKCYLEQTPNNCCLRPMCTDDVGQTVDPIKDPSVYPVVGTMTGGFTGFRPGFLTQTGSVTGSQPGCFYKSKFYRQGQTWDDGCDFSCTCNDGISRKFVCTPKCKRYTALPPECQLLPDPQGCCEIVTCSAATTTAPPPTSAYCHDDIPDCNLYGSPGQDGCVGQYEGWAKRNCAFTCGYCKVTGPANSVSTTPAAPQCQDKIPNCQDYGVAACSGIYKSWAEINCQKYCNLHCTAPGDPTCHDLLPNCQQIGLYYCSDLYKGWAQTNCNATCNLCPSGPVIHAITSGHSGTSKPGVLVTGNKESFGSYGKPGWATLLKGVSGAPGDLWGLWKSPNAKNPGNPDAMELTNRFPDNYKPALSNYWGDCKFEKVKLSVMTNGVENAYITFNATGTNKMNWFDPSRVIDSSYTDLKGAQTDAFTAEGDPNTGRHFVVTQSTRSCDIKGWIMMTTSKQCFFEPNQQPSYLYSTSGQAASFGSGSAAADIFVLSAFGGDCFYNAGNDSVTLNNQHRPVCLFKGNSYKTGQSWQDGCEKNCTCIDEKIGYYKCVDLCPKIQKLPNGCTLEKKPGDCCGKVKCPPVQGGCYYKGQFYGQDQTWEDDCDYDCKCVDSSHGFYQCTAKCLTFHNLPAECRELAAPAGKCCPIVTCPPGITINYPDGYVPK